MTHPRASLITTEAFDTLVRTAMAIDDAFDVRATSMSYGSAELVLRHHARHLRPGNRVSGPVLFALADVALWAMALSVLGPMPMAVTSELSIRFLRAADPVDLHARATGLKLDGRSLVGQVTIGPLDSVDPVAHAVGTYFAPMDGARARGR